MKLQYDGRWSLGNLAWENWTLLEGPAAGASFCVRPGEDIEEKARECEARFGEAEKIHERVCL